MAKASRSMQPTAQVFRVLGDPSRLRIVDTLVESEKNVSQICKLLRMSQPTVSRHLSILKMSRLAIARRDGKEMYYSLPQAKKRRIKGLIDRATGLGN